MGLMRIVKMAGAEVSGVGICIEKAFQRGGDLIRQNGVTLHSLAIVDVKDDGSISFLQK